MPHGNQSESECLLGGKIGKIGKIPGILRVYLEKPGYTRVIPALLHGFAPGTTPTAATTTENPAYHFRIPLYHTTPKLIKISPNTSLIPVKFEHWSAAAVPATSATAPAPAAGVAVTTPTHAEPGGPGTAQSEARVPGGGARGGDGAVTAGQPADRKAGIGGPWVRPGVNCRRRRESS